MCGDFALSGVYTEIGATDNYGAIAFFKWVDKTKGGIAGHRVNYVYINNQSQPAQAEAVAKECILQRHASFIVGPESGADTESAIPARFDAELAVGCREGHLARGQADGPVLVLGLGQGVLVPTVVGVVIARVRAVASGAATGMLVMTQQLAGSLGLLVVSAAFFTSLPHTTSGGSFAGAFCSSLLCDLGFTLAAFVSSRRLGHASSAAPLPGLVPEGG